MEPAGSLPHLQVLFSCPYLEPDQISPHHAIISLLTLSTHLCLGLPSGLFPAGFPNSNLYTLLLYPFVLHDPLILSFLVLTIPIMIGKEYKLVRSSLCSFPTFPTLHHSSVPIVSSAASSQTPLVYFPPLMSESKFHTHTEPLPKY
jgi:hypothetical protein